MNKPPLLILMPMLGNNRAVIDGMTGAVEQTVAYYPFGGVIADLGTPAGGQPYKFGGKELLTANGLNEYDFGARRYYPAVPHFTSIDPLCEKYYPLSPYLYCGNDPVNNIDPSGAIVIGMDLQAQQNITLTLSEDEAKFVRFDENGMLNNKLLNKSTSNSDNMIALKTVANSATKYYVITANEYTVGQETTPMHASSDNGTIGVTLIPNAPYEPSPDENVYIYTSSKLINERMIENMAHELYGHGYFYELNKQGYDVNPFHDMQNIEGELEFDTELNMFSPVFYRCDVNYKLVDQINIVTKQARYNYNRRIKK